MEGGNRVENVIPSSYYGTLDYGNFFIREYRERIITLRHTKKILAQQSDRHILVGTNP